MSYGLRRRAPKPQRDGRTVMSDIDASAIHYNIPEVWNPRTNPADRQHVMPVITPVSARAQRVAERFPKMLVPHQFTYKGGTTFNIFINNMIVKRVIVVFTKVMFRFVILATVNNK